MLRSTNCSPTPEEIDIPTENDFQKKNDGSTEINIGNKALGDEFKE